ncbi:MAG: iron-containing alcohol dehydrogenase [Lachnospiraceae bacterium]|nr:iron-containing alcohol dehydrogenase [Lachnospiraceae bacterium]
MNFNYYLPVNIAFGKGRVDEVGILTKPYGKKVMVVTGRSSAKKSGLLDRVEAALKKESIETVLFDKVSQNPLTTTAIEGAEAAKANNCDAVVAIGGGSIMDCAKAIAFLAVNDGDINEYIFNIRSSDKALPLILIPTTCGTGSEGNGFAVLTNPDTGDKKSLRCSSIVAKVSIIDPECMMTMPKQVLASVGFDALCHCMEAFTSNTAQPFTDALSSYGITRIVDSLPVLYKEDSASFGLWEKLTVASTIGGMVINTAGVTLAHGMEHPASGLKNIVHGQGLAALTPAVTEVIYKGKALDKFEYISKALGGKSSQDCADRLRLFLESIDLSLSLKDLGITAEDIPWMTENCMKVSAGNLANTPIDIKAEDISNIYKTALGGAL